MRRFVSATMSVGREGGGGACGASLPGPVAMSRRRWRCFGSTGFGAIAANVSGSFARIAMRAERLSLQNTSCPCGALAIASSTSASIAACSHFAWSAMRRLLSPSSFAFFASASESRVEVSDALASALRARVVRASICFWRSATRSLSLITSSVGFAMVVVSCAGAAGALGASRMAAPSLSSSSHVQHGQSHPSHVQHSPLAPPQCLQQGCPHEAHGSMHVSASLPWQHSSSSPISPCSCFWSW